MPNGAGSDRPAVVEDDTCAHGGCACTSQAVAMHDSSVTSLRSRKGGPGPVKLALHAVQGQRRVKPSACLLLTTVLVVDNRNGGRLPRGASPQRVGR